MAQISLVDVEKFPAAMETPFTDSCRNIATITHNDACAVNTVAGSANA